MNAEIETKAEELASYKDDPNTNSGLRMTAKQYDRLIAKIDAYLARPADGVAVPREPTREMVKAGAEVDLVNDGDINAIAVNIWHAMIAAAPSDGKGGVE